MSPLILLTLSVYLLITVAGSVIKVRDVSLNEGESINIKLRKGALVYPTEKVVADMRIHFEDEERHESPIIFNKKETDASDLVNRFAIRGNGRCASGQRRRGPVCV